MDVIQVSYRDFGQVFAIEKCVESAFRKLNLCRVVIYSKYFKCIIQYVIQFQEYRELN